MERGEEITALAQTVFIGAITNETSSQCYKTILAEIWKFEISPKDKIARIGHFKSNKQF